MEKQKNNAINDVTQVTFGIRFINCLVAGPDENLGFVITWGRERNSLKEGLKVFGRYEQGPAVVRI